MEKWRKIHKFEILGIREESVKWELVWKSSFSNSLHKDSPCVPKGGHVDYVDVSDFYVIQCKVESNCLELPFWADIVIVCHFAEYFFFC